MKLVDLKALKYFIAYGVMIVGFFTYSGIVGKKWFNPTPTHREGQPGTSHRVHGTGYRYHK
ncbi:hypothetical protein [Pseudochryseolinea flava]|uniref:Uncharacterized protein n=1 Tax=Pseudochryseolinea flava TaxID=2059302 RepID=A0A364XUZ7_9BACT|nr:hypothetical protein [Pseudochryseolinea flava]RAV97962.1 hypothetical protein DQQ10_26180 [Pseudochryseolinea flava]